MARIHLDENKRRGKVNIFSKIFNAVFKLTTARLLLFGFGFLIILGALLLKQNVFLNEGVNIRFIDSLFVSCSAISTTGLSTITIVDTFNVRGIFILLLLMEVGAIGFITFVCFAFKLLGKKLPLKSRMAFEESFDFASSSDVMDIVYKIVSYVFIVEACGAILLMFEFIPKYGAYNGMLLSVFQAVSAFCNSGLDLFGSTSLEIFKSDLYVNIIIALLIFLGSIGYLVVFDIIKKIHIQLDNGFSLKHVFKKFTLNTKLILNTSLGLILFGALVIFIFEYSNKDTLGSMNFLTKIYVSFFQSVSARSGGITTMNLGLMKVYTKLFYIILMFIGGSPASTGGGMKTVTFAVLYLTVIAVMKGKEETIAFDRKISMDVVRKAIVVFFVSVMSVIITTIAVTMIETDMDFLDILFENVSAFSTCGASLGITSSLSTLSKIFIMAQMFVGRLGIVTFLMSINFKEKKSYYLEYPEERIMIIS